MRIIAGALGGRLFATPGTHRTHPMSDRMRGGLFNALGDINGLCVLDAFGGGGAIAFEAASRGAAAVTTIENDRTAQACIAQNITALGLNGRVRLIRSSGAAWLQTNPGAAFDIAICDPPYDDLQPNLLKRLAAHVHPGGLLVLSWPGRTPLPQFFGSPPIKQLGYGDAQLLFWRAP